MWNNPTKSSQYSVLDTQSTVSRSTIFCHISSNQLLTVSRSADMNLGDACLFGLGHFGWALQVFFLTSLVMTGLTTTEPVSTFQSYTRCFYWVLLLGISAMLYWMTNLYASLTFSEIWRLWLFHASRPLVFVHYLKVCFVSYSIRGIARLQPACELLGVSCSLARLSAHGARGLSYFQSQNTTPRTLRMGVLDSRSLEQGFAISLSPPGYPKNACICCTGSDINTKHARHSGNAPLFLKIPN